MTPKQFKQARNSLGLSSAQIGLILNTDKRTIRKWESDQDSRPVNPIAARCMQWFLAGYRPPQWPN